MREKKGEYFCEKCGTKFDSEEIKYVGYDDGDGYVDTEVKAKCKKCGEENEMWQ